MSHVTEEGVGNTGPPPKNDKRCRYMCFTSFQWGIDEENWPELTEAIEDKRVVFCAWQIEKTQTGLPHLQGYIQWKEAQRFAALKKLIRDETCHIECQIKASTPEQAAAYCGKEESRIGGPWSRGKIESRSEKAKNATLELREAVKSGATMTELIDMNPGNIIRMKAIEKYMCLIKHKRNPNITIEYVSGIPFQDPDVFILNTKWWDGYDGQKSVMILKENLTEMQLQLITCGMNCMVDTKGGMIPFRCDLTQKIYIYDKSRSTTEINKALLSMIGMI